MSLVRIQFRTPLNLILIFSKIFYIIYIEKEKNRSINIELVLDGIEGASYKRIHKVRLFEAQPKTLMKIETEVRDQYYLLRI